MTDVSLPNWTVERILIQGHRWLHLLLQHHCSGQPNEAILSVNLYEVD